MSSDRLRWGRVADMSWSPEDFQRKYEEQAAKIGRFNLAVFGKTGVGKSTLINSVFGREVAETGIGKPVTEHVQLHVNDTGSLGLYDTVGLEIGKDTDTVIAELNKLIKDTRTKPLSEQIHAAWYCVRATDRRFEDTEAEFIQRLHDLGLPVILVLTQVYSKDGGYDPDDLTFAKAIADRHLPIVDGEPILVMAKGNDFKGEVEHGLPTLIDATFRVVPEGVQAALDAAQKVDFERKRTRVKAAIGTASGAAAVVGAVPIPFADAALIVPGQIGLIVSISLIYGVKLNLASAATALIPPMLTSIGREIAAGLIKLIPGPGSVAGAVAGAATAGVLTGAMGWAWAAVCEQLAQGKLKNIDGLLDIEAVKRLFSDEFKAWLIKLLPGGSKSE